MYWSRASIGGLLKGANTREGAMSGYGQFCPVAKAMEVLDERWTMLVVRERGNGGVRIDAPSNIRRSIPEWFGQGIFADVPRVPVNAS
jgi:hypothetical protein